MRTSFSIVTMPRGSKTVVHITIRDESEPIYARPFKELDYVLDVDGFRPYGETGKYLTEVVDALYLEVARTSTGVNGTPHARADAQPPADVTDK